MDVYSPCPQVKMENLRSKPVWDRGHTIYLDTPWPRRNQFFFYLAKLPGMDFSCALGTVCSPHQAPNFPRLLGMASSTPKTKMVLNIRSRDTRTLEPAQVSITPGIAWAMPQWTAAERDSKTLCYPSKGRATLAWLISSR